MSDTTGTHQSPTRRERGISAYAAIFSVTEQEVSAALASRVGPVFAEEALQAAGGVAWSSHAFTGRERSIALLASLAAQGVAGNRLASHVQLAVTNGLGEDALTALMTLLTIYVGYAKASLAMETIHGYFS